MGPGPELVFTEALQGEALATGTRGPGPELVSTKALQGGALATEYKGNPYIRARILAINQRDMRND